MQGGGGGIPTPVAPALGGTGTGTVPTEGQLLIGNAGGTYDPTDPSALPVFPPTVAPGGGLAGPFIYGNGVGGTLTLVANTTLAADGQLIVLDNLDLAGFDLNWDAANPYMEIHVSTLLTGDGGDLTGAGRGPIAGTNNGGTGGTLVTGAGAGGAGGVGCAAVHVFARSMVGVNIRVGGGAGVQPAAPLGGGSNANGGGGGGAPQTANMRFAAYLLTIATVAQGGRYGEFAVAGLGGVNNDPAAATKTLHRLYSAAGIHASPLSIGHAAYTLAAGRDPMYGWSQGGYGGGGGTNYVSGEGTPGAGGGGAGGANFWASGGDGGDGGLGGIAPFCGAGGGGGGGGAATWGMLFCDEADTVVFDARGGNGGDGRSDSGGNTAGGGGGGGGAGGYAIGAYSGDVTVQVSGGVGGTAGTGGNDGDGGENGVNCLLER